MANPQKENGHIGLATELVESFAYLQLSPTEWQVLWVVLRQTWGWKKKHDWISLSQFMLKTRLLKYQIIRAKKKLVSKQILLDTKKGLMFNKNYEQWRVSKRIPPVSKRITLGIQTDNLGVSKRIPTIDTNTIDTITIGGLEKLRDDLKNKHIIH